MSRKSADEYLDLIRESGIIRVLTQHDALSITQRPSRLVPVLFESLFRLACSVVSSLMTASLVIKIGSMKMIR